MYEHPELTIVSAKTLSGKVTWRSPANLAIVKYWGKRGVQLPQNPSISLSLSASWSETTVAYSPKNRMDHGISMSFSFEGHSNHFFGERIRNYFALLLPIFPFLKQLHLDVHSRNSFPHSSGIASSASGISALALCLCSIEDLIFDTLGIDTAFRQKASFVARLGSGSACRSIFGTAALWGTMASVPGSSNEFAIPLDAYMHSNIRDLHDAILIIQSEGKKVSSSNGHQTMETHPFAKARYAQARKHAGDLLQVLQSGDIERFGMIAETEALVLHSLMMSCAKGFFLMTSETLKVLELVREFRYSSGYPLYFSLDAGPNVHLLYPDECKGAIEDFIRNQLLDFCEGKKWIADKVGQGPLKID